MSGTPELSRVTIAGPRPAIVFASLLSGLVVATVFTLATFGDAQYGNTGHAFANMGALGVMWTALWAGATSKVLATEDELVFVNFISRTTVPASAVDTVFSENGVYLRTRQGHLVGSTAYQASLLQVGNPSKRYAAAGSAIRAWLKEHSASREDGPTIEISDERYQGRHRVTSRSRSAEGIESKFRSEVLIFLAVSAIVLQLAGQVVVAAARS